MTIRAIINDGLVANVIVADEWPNSIDISNMDPRPSKGWSYDGQTFTAPAEIQSDDPLPYRKVSRLAFRQRFTTAELVAIEIASLDNPSATMESRQLAASLRVMQRHVAEATYVDLAYENTRTGVQQLELVGLLGTGRASEILDGPIAEAEKYNP